MNAPLLSAFVSFVKDREALRIDRTTNDPILKSHHFCNVNREHDRVTSWIHTHVRTKHYREKREYMLLQLLACRIFNDPPALGVILPISPSLRLMQTSLKALKKFKAEGNRIMRGAYMMPTHGAGPRATGPVEDYWFDTLWQCSKLDLRDCVFLEEVSVQLLKLHGVGEFVANQVLTDLRYVPGWGSKFPDWNTFILCGPGTKRGMNRFKGRALDWKQDSLSWSMELLDIRNLFNKHQDFPLPIQGYFCDPNNLSNCFCEFDKYCRAVDAVTAGTKITLRHYHPHGNQNT